MFQERVPAKKRYPNNDDQLHPNEASLIQVRISKLNKNYVRFKVSSMNLPCAASRDQIPPSNVATYSRHCGRANEL